MVRNEPSDRQDRRIQRRKLRQMWAGILEERERLAMMPERPKTVHYIDRDGVDVTDDVMPSILLMIGALAALMIVLCAVV